MGDIDPSKLRASCLQTLHSAKSDTFLSQNVPESEARPACKTETPKDVVQSEGFPYLTGMLATVGTVDPWGKSNKPLPPSSRVSLTARKGINLLKNPHYFTCKPRKQCRTVPRKNRPVFYDDTRDVSIRRGVRPLWWDEYDDVDDVEGYSHGLSYLR